MDHQTTHTEYHFESEVDICNAIFDDRTKWGRAEPRTKTVVIYRRKYTQPYLFRLTQRTTKPLAAAYTLHPRSLTWPRARLTRRTLLSMDMQQPPRQLPEGEYFGLSESGFRLYRQQRGLTWGDCCFDEIPHCEHNIPHGHVCRPTCRPARLYYQFQCATQEKFRPRL